MPCPTCATENPEVALFCYRCGTSLRGSASTRTGSYAVQSSEGVNQFALISTIMPHTNRETADNYRWAMIFSAVLIIGATALGLLPIAIASAAFLIPIVYLVYIYDVNLLEDAPVLVVAGLFLGHRRDGDPGLALLLPLGLRGRVHQLRLQLADRHLGAVRARAADLRRAAADRRRWS